MAGVDRPVRLTYDRGNLEIISPLREHEKFKTIIGGLIETLSVEFDIPIEPLGSTTFRRKRLAKGLEADECYYIQHGPDVRGGGEINLERDPPPDLAVEIDITHHAIDRDRVYAALGIPELWRFDGRHLMAMKLSPNRSRTGKSTTSSHCYAPIIKSLAFPFLTAKDLEPFIQKAASSGYTPAIRAFREWLQSQRKT
jgi:Uma2 family endonuclease